jgi:hypothetical protein
VPEHGFLTKNLKKSIIVIPKPTAEKIPAHFFYRKKDKI